VELGGDHQHCEGFDARYDPGRPTHGWTSHWAFSRSMLVLKGMEQIINIYCFKDLLALGLSKL
jgi:hypothetical protein